MTDQTLELVELVFQVSRLMKQKMILTGNLMELNILHTQTLIFLNHNKQATMSDIAGYLHIELPSVTSLVNKLVKQNLVERSSDPEDRRIVKIVLTDNGKKLLQQAINMRKKKLEQFLSYLSDQQKNELLTILQTVQHNLQD